MCKINMSEEVLLKKYNYYIDFISDECDWVTTFSAKDVCNIVYNILSDNNIIVNFSEEELYNEYISYIENLNLGVDEWANNYGIPQIITIIYDVIYNFK